MDTHKNAALTPKGREMMVRAVVDFGLSKAAAARQFNTTSKTVAKWVDVSRSKASKACATAHQGRFHRRANDAGHLRGGRGLAQAASYRQADRGRGRGFGGNRQPHSERLGLNRLAALEPAEPVRRYERAAPGEILHIDIKKLGKFNRIGHRITGDRNGQSNTRGVGWEYVHLAIDDHSRVAYSEILPDEKRGSCLRFLFNALRFFRSLDVKVRRVMTDNGSSFRSRRYAKALRLLKIKHLRTRPYTPKTTDVIDKCFLAGSELFSSRARVTARRRAGREAQALPRSLHRRTSVAAPVRTRLGPRGFQPATKRA